MAKEDTTLKKTEASKGEHPVKEKVEKTIDIRKDLTMEEAEKLVAQEEGGIPEAPASQASEKEEKEEKAEESPKEKEGEKAGSIPIPERYKGKSAEELVRLLDEKEKYIQSRSDEIGEWRQKGKEAEELREKVIKIEEEAIQQAQQPSKLPPKPVISDDEYYDDPTKAIKKLIDYVDQLTSAKTAPFYQSDIEKRREKLYGKMEEKYKNHPIKFDRNKVQEFLNKNPQYFTKYKVNAYEQAYHDISATDFGKKQKEEQEIMREQVKREVMEEMKNQSQAGNVGLGDLEPQSINPTGSAPEYDIEKMEDDPEYRAQVIKDLEKRRK